MSTGTLETVGLDTSALVRIISGEPPELAEKVARRVAGIIDGGGTCLVGDIAAFEAYYALQQFYGMTKGEVLGHLRELPDGGFNSGDSEPRPGESRLHRPRSRRRIPRRGRRDPFLREIFQKLPGAIVVS